jgi:hypothetical protein
MKAPWTPQQVAALNRYQASGFAHPFTCGNRSRDTHPTIANGDFGVLVATEYGWKCPDCDYTQDWAHDGMLNEPIDPLAEWQKDIDEKSGKSSL